MKRGLTKEEAKKALEDDIDITIGSLYASRLPDGKIYVNCYPDCNCSQDVLDNFEIFWINWGHEFAERGRIE